MPSIKLITVVVCAIFLLVEGMYMRFGSLYFMAGTLLVLPFVSYAVARLVMRGLSASLDAPGYVTEGDLIPIRISVSGLSGLLGPIEVDDNLPEWFQRSAGSSMVMTAEQDISYDVIATKRGEYMLGPMNLYAADPLGFFTFVVKQESTSRMVVLPSPLEVPGLQVGAASSFAEFGIGSPGGRGLKGSGLDFHGVREYQQGDELRRVHWPSTARHGRLDVIEFEHIPVPDTVIAIDLRKGSVVGSGRFSSLEYSIKLAAYIAGQSMLRGGVVSLAGLWEGDAVSMPSTGAEHLYAILEALARVRAERELSLADDLTKELDLIRMGSEVICLVSQLDETLVRCAEILSTRGICVRIIVIAPGDTENSIDGFASQILSVGASLTVLECSDSTMSCRVKYEYAQ